MDIQLPISLNSLLAIIATQAFIGSTISILMERLPFIQNKAVADWKKLGVIVLICLAWAIGSTMILQGGLPHDPNGWYLLVISAVVVILTNQGAYELVNTVFPGIGDWLLLFAGKTTTASMTISTSVPSATATVISSAPLAPVVNPTQLGG